MSKNDVISCSWVAIDFILMHLSITSVLWVLPTIREHFTITPWIRYEAENNFREIVSSKNQYLQGNTSNTPVLFDNCYHCEARNKLNNNQKHGMRCCMTS